MLNNPSPEWTLTPAKSSGADVCRIPEEPVGINPNSPAYADGSFYTSSGYEWRCRRSTDDGTSVTRVWTDRVLTATTGAPCWWTATSTARISGHYDGNWVCLDGHGQVMYEPVVEQGRDHRVDGLLYCYEEKGGTVGLVKPSPSASK